MSRAMAIMCGVACLLLAAGVSQGALLGLTINHYPRVYTSSTVQVDYSVASGKLTAYGLAWDVYTSETSVVPLNDGVFELEVFLNQDGTPNSGTLLVTGDYPGPATQTLFYSTTLYTPPPSFGYGAEDLFEFLFRQEGTTPLISNDEIIGIILDARQLDEFNYPDEPRFDIDFHGDGLAYSNTFFFPEPGTLILLALGGLALASRRRR